ncbi:MAG: hypothetical protein KBD16_04425 [Candidatus Pacebacteria bacterium]|nr:hypothetical protein [Candidatus Paceibacterota bacterium]
MHNPHNLENIRVRPLSDAEQSRSWSAIKMRMPETAIISPVSFFSYKAFSLAAVFVIVLGGVGFADSARPGQLLFSVDRAVESIETSIDSSANAKHARERLSEFDEVIPQNDTTLADMDVSTRMQKSAAPEAPIVESEAAAMFMALDATVAEETALDPETQALVNQTRMELLKLEADATLRDDEETLREIQNTIAEFEARVQTLFQ